MSFTTDLDLGTSLFSLFNITHYTVVLKLRNLGTLEGVLLEWITDLVLLGASLESLNELVVNALLNIYTGASTAALAVVKEDTKVHPSVMCPDVSYYLGFDKGCQELKASGVYGIGDPRDGIFNIGIVEDDVWRLSTQLEGDLL